MYILLGIVTVLTTGCYTRCYNEDGDQRPWFALFKMPMSYNYLYADSVNEELVKGVYDLTDPRNPVARVLAPIYEKDPEEFVNYILYNDQSPDGTVSTNRGHTKGAVVWRDNTTAQWLVHSVPNFPPVPDSGYSYPETARRYGQTILCMDLDTEADLPGIIKQLYYTWPLIYNASVAVRYEAVEHMGEVLGGKHFKGDPSLLTQDFQTRDSQMKFTGFGKTGEFGADIYRDVARYLNQHIYTETWQHGTGRLASNCTNPNHVYNIQHMSLAGQQYSEGEDHSKWVVSGSGDTLCIGGTNRMSSQFKRGGGTICFKPTTLAKQVRSGVVLYEPCQ